MGEVRICGWFSALGGYMARQGGTVAVLRRGKERVWRFGLLEGGERGCMEARDSSRWLGAEGGSQGRCLDDMHDDGLHTCEVW